MAIFGATLLLAGVATSCSKICDCTVTGDGGYSYTINDVNLKGSSFKNCNAYADYLNDQYNYIGGVKVDCKKH